MPRTKQSGLFQPLSGLRGHDPEDLLALEQLSKKAPRKYTKRAKTPAKSIKLPDPILSPEPIVEEEKGIKEAEEDIQIEILVDYYDTRDETTRSVAETIIKINEERQSIKSVKKTLKEEKTQKASRREDSTPFSQIQDESSTPEVKRKRGRPRKHPLPVETIPEEELSVEESPYTTETQNTEESRVVNSSEKTPPKRRGRKPKNQKMIDNKEESKSERKLSLSSQNTEESEVEETPEETLPRRRGRPKKKKTIDEPSSWIEEKLTERKLLVIRPILSKRGINMGQEGQNQSEKRKRTKSIDTESEKLTKSSPEKKIKNDENVEKDSLDSLSFISSSSEFSTKKSDDFADPSEGSASDENQVAKFTTPSKRGRKKKSELEKLNALKTVRPKRAGQFVTSYKI